MLVPVPWQTHLLVHKDLLVKLEQLRARLGRPPMLYPQLSAWRSYAQQKELWNRYLAGTGNPASNPDSSRSPNTHMRGVAADLADTSQTMQAACIAVGLQRDPGEAWHWQLPAWRDYPIIEQLPPEPEPEREEPFMPFNIAKASTLKSGQHVAGTVCATVGAFPVGFDEYTRKPSTAEDRGPLMGKAYGPHEPVSDVVWAELKVRYTASAGGGGDNAAVLAAVAEVHADVNKARTLS
jgi:hypothetical protein